MGRKSVISARHRGVFALLIVLLALSGTLTSCRPPQPGGATPTTATPGATPTTAPPAVQQTRTLRYGPYTVPAAQGSEMGMLKNRLAFGVARPCNDCYITGMQANLITPDGETVNIDDGLWLHHIVMADVTKEDLTCSRVEGQGILGQRFFSSGNERSPIKPQGPYGYAQPGSGAYWTLLYDLMNMTAEARSVYVTMTYDFVPISTPGYRAMTPMLLDIAPCTNSEQPARPGVFTYNYSLTSRWTGQLIGIGGHLHDGGVNLTIAKNGQVFCDSRATYGGDPAYVEGSNSLHMPGMVHLSKMSICHRTAAGPVTTIVPGDRIDLAANYDMTNQHGDGHPVMGIAIGYLDLG
jgi:hypothetical protein